MRIGSEEVFDLVGDAPAVMSEVVGCAKDKVFRDVIEVAAVVGMVAVDGSEVAIESLDVAKVDPRRSMRGDGRRGEQLALI
jgi:precorrin isomerase